MRKFLLTLVVLLGVGISSANASVPVIFNIDQLVIESWNLPAAEGSPGIQPYQLICSSDRTFDLEFTTSGNKAAGVWLGF